METLETIANAMGWEPNLSDTVEGHQASWKTLIFENRMP